MKTDEFEWDDQKAAGNAAKHGVTFEMATLAFDDPFALWLDTDNDDGELRECLIGITEDLVLFVVFTMRGDRMRIISARIAEPHERRRYHEQQG